MVGDRKRGGQSGTFDTEQIDQPWHAVRLRSLDNEILSRGTLRHDLRADPGISWLQRPVLQRRPVFAYGRVEAVRAGRVDGVVEGIDPLDIRPKPSLAAQIHRQVHAEAARHRHGIDQPRERRPPRQREVVTFGVMNRRHPIGRHAG